MELSLTKQMPLLNGFDEANLCLDLALAQVIPMVHLPFKLIDFFS